jgi:hypothetical protein
LQDSVPKIEIDAWRKERMIFITLRMKKKETPTGEKRKKVGQKSDSFEQLWYH